MDDFVAVARVSEIAPGQVKLVRVKGQSIGIANVDGSFYAFADVCTHDDGPLAEGELEGRQIVCPRHGARFDVSSGAALSMPAVTPTPVYDLIVEGDQIKVNPKPRGL